MKPGRNLDTNVAQEVMGWSNIILNPATQDFVGEPAPSKNGVIPVPRFSTDFRDALEVIERFDSWTLQKTNASNNRKGVAVTAFHCRLMRFEDRTQGDASSADSAAHAICLAALKAVGAATA
jgi:hypothetical protein